nr:UPF0415 protein C7orf25 homolog [Lytechinus pictus]
MEAINMESSLAGELSALRERAEDLMKRADLLKANGNIAGIGKVKKKIQSELTFIKSLQEGKVLPKKNQLKSTNLSHLDDILHTAETFEHVTVSCARPTLRRRMDTSAVCSWMLLATMGSLGSRSRLPRKAEALHRIWEGAYRLPWHLLWW